MGVLLRGLKDRAVQALLITLALSKCVLLFHF